MQIKRANAIPVLFDTSLNPNIFISMRAKLSLYDVRILVKEVRLATKFACSLRFEHNGAILTPEVTPQDGLFQFAKELQLKGSTLDSHIELQIYLNSGKGKDIQAGILKLNLAEMKYSYTETTESFGCCVDPQARCTYRVITASITGQKDPSSKMGNKLNKHKSTKVFLNHDEYETRSQVHYQFEKPSFDPLSRMNRSRRLNDFPSRINQVTPNEFKPEQHQFKLGNGYRLDNQEELFSRKDPDLDDRRSIAFKKTKMLINAHEATEQNLKLEIIRYKDKNENLDRMLEEKTATIKELKEKLSNSGKELSEANYRLNELHSKEAENMRLESDYRSLSQQLQQQKSKYMELYRKMETGRQLHEKAVATQRMEAERKDMEHFKSINISKIQLKDKTEECSRKNAQIESMKSVIHELETAQKKKATETDRIVSLQREEFARLKQAFSNQVIDLEEQLRTYENNYKALAERMRKLEGDEAQRIVYVGLLQKKNQEIIVLLNREQENGRALQHEKRVLLQKIEKCNLSAERTMKHLDLKDKELCDFKAMHDDQYSAQTNKISELIDKNKVFVSKIQDYELATAQAAQREDKIKKSLQNAEQQLLNKIETEKTLRIQIDSLEAKHRQVTRVHLEQIKDLGYRMESLKKDLQKTAAGESKLSSKHGELEQFYSNLKAENASKVVALSILQNKAKFYEQALQKSAEHEKSLKEQYDQLRDKLEALEATHRRDSSDRVKEVSDLKQQLTKALSDSQTDKTQTKTEIAKIEAREKQMQHKLDANARKEAEKEYQYKLLQRDYDQRNQKITTLQTEISSLQKRLKEQQGETLKMEKLKQVTEEDRNRLKDEQAGLYRETDMLTRREADKNSEANGLKEEVMRLQACMTSLKNEHERFKENISDTIRGAQLSNASMRGSRTNLNGLAGSRSLSRSMMSRSRMRITETDETNLIEMLEEYASEMNGAVAVLNEENRRLTNKLETELMEMKSQHSEETKEKLRLIDQINADRNNLAQKMHYVEEEYQHQFTELDEQISQRCHRITKLEQQLAEVMNLLESEKGHYHKHLFQLSQILEEQKVRIAQLQDMHDSEAMRCDTLLKEKEAIRREASNSTDCWRKTEEELQQMTGQLEEIKRENEKLVSYKNALNIEVVENSEKLIHEREKASRLAIFLQEEETKSRKLKEFTDSLLQTKEVLITNQLQKAQSIYDLERTVDQLRDNSSEQLHHSQQIISDLKQVISQRQAKLQIQEDKIKEMEEVEEKRKSQGQETKSKKSRAPQKQVEDRREEVKELRKAMDLMKKTHQEQLTRCNADYEELAVKCREIQKAVEEKDTVDLAKKAEQLEEQLFFEKQGRSLQLAQSCTLKASVQRMEVDILKLKQQLQTAHEQLKNAGQEMDEAKVRISELQKTLEISERKHRADIERSEWSMKEKADEQTQELQIRLGSTLKEKNAIALRNAILLEEIGKLQSGRRQLERDSEAERNALVERIKQLEEQKLAIAAEKNREIAKLNECIFGMKSQEADALFDLKCLNDEKLFLDEQLRLARQQYAELQGEYNRKMSQYEQEIEVERRKGGQLDKFRSTLEGQKWEIERGVKRVFQDLERGIEAGKDWREEVRAGEGEVCRVLMTIGAN